MADDYELTQAQREWMTELYRLGAEKGLYGFPKEPPEPEWNCWLEDYDAGLTPQEAIAEAEAFERKLAARQDVTILNGV